MFCLATNNIMVRRSIFGQRELNVASTRFRHSTAVAYNSVENADAIRVRGALCLAAKGDFGWSGLLECNDMRRNTVLNKNFVELLIAQSFFTSTATDIGLHQVCAAAS